MSDAPSVCCVVQARMTSTRLPGKVLLPLGGQTILQQVLLRISRIEGLDSIAVAIPDGIEHDPIYELVESVKGDFSLKVNCIRGSEEDVLDRTLKAARANAADYVMRITSDCPFVDPTLSAGLLKDCLAGGYEYARFNSEKGYPLGFDTEVVTVAALETAAKSRPDGFEREHVTPYIWRRPEAFRSLVVTGFPDNRHLRLVIDEESDYEFAQRLWAHLEKRQPRFSYEDILAVLRDHPDLLTINRHVQQKAMIGRTQHAE